MKLHRKQVVNDTQQNPQILNQPLSEPKSDIPELVTNLLHYWDISCNTGSSKFNKILCTNKKALNLMFSGNANHKKDEVLTGYTGKSFSK